jgi:riboflavin synthase
VTPLGNGRELAIGAEKVLEDLAPGASINVDGVCQTVVSLRGGTFTVQAIATTLSRTTLGEFRRGRRVNLERAVAAGARFCGHFVQGHVDGVGTVTSVERRGEMWLVRFTLPASVAPYTILHGSIAVDGVSLTINTLPEPGTAEVALIPYTYEHTNLSRLAPGMRVNLEADMIGKYVVRALEPVRGGSEPGGLSRRLSEWGIG